MSPNRLTTREDLDDSAVSKSPDSPNLDSTPPLDIYVKTQTWPIDQRGLLHHRSSAVSTREFKVRTACDSFALQRQMLDTDLVHQDQTLAPPCETLFHLEPASSATFRLLRKPGDLWEHIPAHTPRPIAVSDILRFGSLRLRVSDLVRSPSDARSDVLLQLSLDTTTATTTATPFTTTEEKEGCRICFEEEETESNRLLTPCMCRGSVRHVHSECLKHWVDGQLLVRRLPEGGGCYVLKELYCELCKYPYDASVYKNILIKRPNGPHMVLEELDAGNVNKIHVVPLMQKKSLTVGRSKECDIWLADISVSRKHARIAVEGELKVEDVGSKFGSLVLMKDTTIIEPDKNATQVQIGNSLITIKITSISRIATFLIPKRFQPELGKIRIVGNREPSRKVLEREVERRLRATVLHEELVAPFALPIPTIAQGEQDVQDEEQDNQSEIVADEMEEHTTVFNGSPTHARRALLEEEDPVMSSS